MSIRLLVKQRGTPGGAQGTEIVLEQGIVTLGRDSSCQVVLSEHAVSRNHARITREGSLCFLEDLGSAYGTSVNGQRLPEREKRLLRNSDVIAIAQFDLVFEDIPDLRMLSEKTSLVTRQAVKDAVQGLTGAEPFFRIMNGEREGERIEVVNAKELVIGRDPACDLIIEDALISRRHVKIRRDWAGTHAEDLQSRNGIKVNNRRTSHRTLKDKDELQIGNFRLLYVDPSEVKEATGDIPLGNPGSAPKSAPQEPVKEASIPGQAPPQAPGAPPPLLPQQVPGTTQGGNVAGEKADDFEEEDPPKVENPRTSARNRMIAVAAMALLGLLALGITIAMLMGA
jgi:pSer/pThr/pTyr-binding forkhead associated (FHA) protein